MEKNKDLVALGNNLRMIRLKDRLNQENFAEITGISNAAHLGKIENGLVDIKVSTLFNIMRSLNINFEDLINLNN